LENEKIITILDKMIESEVNSGDITTESISLYPLHATGQLISKQDGFFFGKHIINYFFEKPDNQLKITWNIEDGQKIKDGTKIFEFIGNGANILKLRNLLIWISGRLSAIITETTKATELLNQYGKILLSGHNLTPLYSSIDLLAFENGGGKVSYKGLSENILIFPEYANYTGNMQLSVDQINEELGRSRGTLRIEVIANNFDQFMEYQKMDIDTIHLQDCDKSQIKKIFTEGNPNKKPILHLKNISDWKEEYEKYFFKFCIFDDLLSQVKNLKTDLTFNPKSQ